ncbi:sensor histidine kinase [Kordiimonas aestuarii]|uniref:sensor histidine kinase n=1 Tax=Kordiimonas aestuarii TaxID=1005925 RepID=UPI0021CF2ECA|nr:HAMP domain-containing sensor histidine kinase [Kordiimonas aestuarii]
MSAARQQRQSSAPSSTLGQISSHIGFTYFRELTQALCDDFGADIAFIAYFAEAGTETAKSLALCENGETKPPANFPLPGTPCWETANNGSCFYASGVRDVYPDDEYLARHEIESYVGVALPGEDGKERCGVMVAMARTPLQEDDPLRTFVAAASSRTRSELLHYVAERKLKETISQALLLNYSKSMFMANISHELRTPIGAMVGYASLIRDSELDKKTLHSHANQIAASGESLLALIGDIMSLAMLEISDETAKRERFDLLDIARTGRRLIQQQAASKNLAVRAATRTDSLLVLGDAGHTKKALMNLLTNAVKYTSSGTIEIAVDRAEDGSARLSVTDTGVGMNAEEIKAACQPLGTFTHAYDMHQEGAGLGLPITMLLMQRQNGRLEMESESGKGTKAHLIFPSCIVTEEGGDFI